jgi:hypothetical protein
MSSAKDANHSHVNNVTRQRLDDLDALMQRMLALPVDPGSDLEEAPSRPPEFAEFQFDKPTAPASSASASDDNPVPQVSPPRETGNEQVAETAGSVITPPIAPPLREEKQLRPAHTATALTIRSSLRISPVRPPVLLRPILWINYSFDWCTGWFGPPGRWLRSWPGRNLVGWVGLALFVAAVAWVIFDTTGWSW